MSCDFEAEFDNPRTQVTITWVSGQKFGTLPGGLLFDTEVIAPTSLKTWAPELIVADLPAHLPPGMHTVTIMPPGGSICSKSGIDVPPGEGDPSLALIHVVPLDAPIGSVVKVRASGLTFTRALHAPIELRDRSDTRRYTWQADAVTGWDTGELTLTLPTAEQYEGGFSGAAVDRPHTLLLGVSQHRPALLLLEQALDPCDTATLTAYLKQLASVATTKLGAPAAATDFDAADTVVATVTRTTSANLLGQLVASPSSGYHLLTALRLLDAAGQVVVPPGSQGLSGAQQVVDTPSANFRLPTQVATSTSAAKVAYTLELVAELATPATACANRLVEKLQSIALTVAPIPVPSVLVLFDHKTPPFDGSSNAGDALVFVRSNTVAGLADGVHDATPRGTPGTARTAVVSTLGTLVTTLRLAAQSGWTGLPLPPGPHLDRLTVCCEALANAARVSVVVGPAIADLGTVLFHKGWLWNDHANDWAGSGFMVAPPGVSVTAHDNTGHKGSSCRLGVPSNSLLSETPSLWNPANTYTNRLIVSGSGNWYNRISSLRWT